MFVGLPDTCFFAQGIPQTRDDDWSHRKVRFGVNGHPLNSESYERMPLEQQLPRLKAIGLRTYRVNVNPEHTEKLDTLSELTTLAEREGIRSSLPSNIQMRARHTPA
jgi:hypothetical protein